ncbi:hypothetical protein KFE98_04425 [bacterium SCSIO 12741]|nr:hypothetical protein KFE98_04425 [bacterium SCSIO 12741]
MIAKERNIDFFFGIAIIYFFFNNFLIPQGLLYLFFLTPFFYYWMIKKGVKNVLGYFFIVLLPYFVVHLSVGVDLFYYFKSVVLYLLTYIIVYTFYVYLKENTGKLERVYGKIVLLNFAMTIVAVIAFFTPLKEFFWYSKNLTHNITNISRLMMLTYEPSYYSTLLVPIVLYYFLGFFVKRYTPRQVAFLLIFIGIPLLISFSLGVLSSLTFAMVVTFLFFFKTLMKSRKVLYTVTGSTALVLFAFITLLVVYPDNPLFLRIEDIFAGEDTSGKGRTFEAWKLSFQMIELKSYWFGCGLGQMKVVGEEVVRVYYKYQIDDIPIIRIPSVTGETISVFGITGIVARFVLEFYFFFKTKVYRNYYRFSLFAYIFLYQFTGSYLTNIAEYVIWVIAFVPGFHDFDKKQKTVST